MSEGEFKKRLDHNKNTVNACPDKEDYVNYTEEIIIWLDEAKRDYPSLISLGLVPKLTQADIDKIDEARAKWFVKWFGK